jgi:hypothetical protein
LRVFCSAQARHLLLVRAAAEQQEEPAVRQEA